MTMNLKNWMAVAGMLCAVCALPALAQTSGGIKGQVIGVDGKPMAKAVLTFTRTDVPAKYTVTADKNGKFGDYTLPVGTYDVSVKGTDGSDIPVEKGLATHVGEAQQAVINLKVLQAAEAGAAPPPGMTKEEAAAYEKKVKEQEEKNQKLGKLNELLQQNKQFLDAKQYDQAIGVMEQAVALDQTHDILYANLAEDYSEAKQYDKAADAYQKAIALKPRNAGYVINLGTVLAKSGKIDDANAAFAKAAQLDPTQAKMAMFNTGVVLFNQGNLDAGRRLRQAGDPGSDQCGCLVLQGHLPARQGGDRSQDEQAGAAAGHGRGAEEVAAAGPQWTQCRQRQVGAGADRRRNLGNRDQRPGNGGGAERASPVLLFSARWRRARPAPATPA